MDALKKIEAFYAEIRAAGAVPITAGGDHLISLPILRALGEGRPLGMIHFDAHSDTNDRYFGDNRYTHGTPFRRAIEEGVLDPKRVVQIGIRGSIYDPADFDFANANGVRIIFIEEFARRGAADVMAEARAIVGEQADLCLLRHRLHRSLDGARHRHARDRRHHDARGAGTCPRAARRSISSAPTWSRSRRRSIRRHDGAGRRHDDVRAPLRDRREARGKSRRIGASHGAWLSRPAG